MRERIQRKQKNVKKSHIRLAGNADKDMFVFGLVRHPFVRLVTQLSPSLFGYRFCKLYRELLFSVESLNRLII